MSSVPQPGPSTAKPLEPSGDGIEDEELSDHTDDNDDNDSNFVDKSRKKKKSDMINVRIPRNVFMSPALISSLDRCKTSDSGVMRTFAQVFKQCETEDGKKIKLDEFVLSRSSIRIARIEQRTVIVETEIAKFKLNMPLRLAYGWDGKMLKDMMNVKHKMQAMVLSGLQRTTLPPSATLTSPC